MPQPSKWKEGLFIGLILGFILGMILGFWKISTPNTEVINIGKVLAHIYIFAFVGTGIGGLIGGIFGANIRDY